LSDDEDHVYGSFNIRENDTAAGSSSTTWKALKDALASISPW
jgi:hypothetical protein